MKYEFTGKEKKVNGRALKQIRALVAIGALVSAGDVGGWVETEGNLPQVSGDAWVFGNAQVSGDARVSITPITITGMYYQIDIDDKMVRVGCQQHNADNWAKFSLSEIMAMDGKSATDFYPTLLSIIKSIAKPHQDKIKES